MNSTISPQAELSSNKDALKKLQDSIDTLLAQNRTNTPDTEAYCSALNRIESIKKTIDTNLPVEKMKLTKWEKNLFKTIAVLVLDSKYGIVTLSDIRKAAELEHNLDLTVVIQCTNLLESRGLIRSLTKEELDSLADGITDDARSIIVNQKGRIYYAREFL